MLAAFEIFGVFVLMRLIQFLLGMGLSRGENTSTTFVCATVTLFFLIYIICTSVVFMTADRESKEVQQTIVG